MSDNIDVKIIDTSKHDDIKHRTKVKDTEYKEGKIYVRSINGVFTAIRQKLNWILMLGFFLLPWIPYGDRQAVIFDLAEQKFHIFGLIIWPQDLVLLAALLMIAAYALFLVTTFIGRVWCGFTCPQTIWTFIFIWVEEKVEGKFNKRKKLDQQANNWDKIWKKGLKHSIWLFISLITSLTFLAFFVPVQQLYIDVFTLNASGLIYFWTLFFTFCTYGNAGWMREIMCLHMCPYARFQSAMFDKDTFSVAYDAQRGESRGPRSRKKDPKELGLGDCIDCNLCVQVCPTGIDIRDGLQYECINSGACIDACDNTMERMGYEKGLINYTTEHRLEGHSTKVMRPKLLGYGAILIVMLGLFFAQIASVDPAGLSVLRDRNQLFRVNNQGLVENTYTLKVINKTQQEQEYKLDVSGLPDSIWYGKQTITVDPGEVLNLPISLGADPEKLSSPVSTIQFILSDNEEFTMEVESRFIKKL